MVQLGFYFDQSRCTGCYACSIACRDWHDIQDPGVQWRRVTSCEQGTFPEVRLSYLSLSCNHCARPACAEACPVGAITKGNDDGVVAVDRGRCLGRDSCAMFCREACPYAVPQFAGDKDAAMQMCTLCADRRAAGKNPACVDACPLRALDWGPLDELEKKYGRTRDAEGFAWSEATCPSLIIKPRYETVRGQGKHVYWKCGL